MLPNDSRFAAFQGFESQRRRWSLRPNRIALAAALVASSLGMASAQMVQEPRLPTDPAKPRVLKSEGYAANVNVARILVEVDRDGVPADGQSAVQVTVRLFGQDGQPLASEAFATVEVSAGRLLLPGARTDEQGPRGADADKAVPGVQMTVRNGVAQFALLAPSQPQEVMLRVTAGQVDAQGSLHFMPEMRSMVAAGLVEGIIGFGRKVALSPVRRGDGFEREIRAWQKEFDNGKGSVGARVAFFLKGTIKGDVLLTASFDSDRETRARMLSDIRPDQYYPVYGDSALRSKEAVTGSRLYVRVDKGKHYLLWGDFVTGDGFTQSAGLGRVASLKQRSLGNYNRTATGVRAHHEEGNLTLNAFAFNDTLKRMVEEFVSQGSGPYGLSNNAVVEGTEKVEVLVRDRNEPSRILSVRALTRLVDYSFEPFSGRILLSNFLPAVDEQLNPMSLRVTYEFDQGGNPFWVAGVDGQLKLGRGLEVGGSVVEDRNPLAPYRLASANAGWQLGPRTAIVVEAAQTSSTVNTNPTNQSNAPGLAGRVGEVTGRAARVELVHEDERTEARVFYGRSSPLFNNPSAPLQGGREEALVQGGLKLTDSLKLTADALRSEDRSGGGGHKEQAGLDLQWAATDKLNLKLGVREQRETTGTQSTGLSTWPYGQASSLSGSLVSGSGGGAVGYGNQALDPTTGLPIVQQSSLMPSASSLPAGTRLESRTAQIGLTYQLTERVRVGGELEADVSGEERKRASLGADYRIAERSKLYGRVERQSGWVQLGGMSDRATDATALVAGVDTTYWADTQAFTEYRLRDAMSGRDVQLASGVRQNWDVTEGLRMSGAVENLKVVSGLAPAVQAVSVGLDYTGAALWRLGTRLEFRRSGDIRSTTEDERFNTTLWQVMVARKLSRDWTLLARNYLLNTDYRSKGDVTQDRAQLGFAYRETDRNRMNALAKVEYKQERDDSNASLGSLRTRAWIFSTVADWHSSRPWWVTGRVAGKWQADRFEGGVTDSFNAKLLSIRLVYDITENWDVNVLGAAMLGQKRARQTAYGVEVGYLLQQNLWLSAGYNATGFSADADLNGYEYTNQGAYLRLRFKFDEDLFKGRDPEVNRSLPR